MENKSKKTISENLKEVGYIDLELIKGCKTNANILSKLKGKWLGDESLEELLNDLKEIK